MAKKKKPQTDKEISLVVQEGEEITQSLEPMQDRISALDMNRDENYETLLENGRVVREVQRQVESKRKWAVSGIQEAIKRVKSLFDPMLTVCRETMELIDQKHLEYSQIQDRKQEEEQKRLDQEAEEEEKRIRRNLQAKARRADKKGDVEKAEELIWEADHTKVEAAQAEKEEAPKVDGVSVAKIWTYEILDPELVPERVGFVKTGEVFILWERNFTREALLVVRKYCEEHDRDITELVPGVRFFQKDSPRYGRL